MSKRRRRLSNKTDGFVNICAAAEMGEISPFSGLILSRKMLLPFCEHWAAVRPVRMEDCPVFPDTDLPLALIMEEILGWEKKEDSDKEKEDSTS